MRRRRIVGCGGLGDYFEMCRESDGFDVNPLGRYLCGGIAEGDQSAEEDTEDVIKSAKYALDDYNKENNSDLRFVSLIKYNGQIAGGMMYYITFKARSRTLKKTSIYQAKVYYETEKVDPVVYIFRQKPKPAIPVPKGAFLRFMNKLTKMPGVSHWTREKQISLASRAWKNLSNACKLRFCNAEYLDYEDIARFVE